MIPEKKFFAATLYPRTHDISKTWFIKFQVKDYEAGKLRFKKIYGYLNLIDNVDDRIKEANRYIEMLNNNELPPFAQGARNKPPLEAEGNFAVVRKVLANCLNKYKSQFYTEPQKVRYKNIKSKVNTLISWLEKNNYQHLTIAKLQSATCKEFLLYLLLQKKLTIKTRNCYKTDFTLLWKLLIDDDIIKFNPWKECEWMPHASQPFKKHTEDVQTIIEHELPKQDIQLYIAVWFIYGCYMRVIELSRLKISAIDFIRGVVKIDQHVCFKSKTREIPLPIKLLDTLKAYGYHQYNEDCYVFGANGFPSTTRIKYHYLRNKWKKFASQNNIPSKYKLYGLKHTGNTKMALTGINSRTLQKLNGHSSLEYIQKNYTGEISVDELMWLRQYQPQLGQPVKPQIQQRDEQMELLKAIKEKLDKLT